MHLIPVILLLPFFLSFTHGLNILGLFVYPSFHHWTVHNSLISELSKRGHNLTVLTNFPTTENSSNYREIHVKPFYSPEIEIGDRLQLTNVSQIRLLDPRKIIDHRFESGLSATKHFLAATKFFLDQLRTEKPTYDVILVADYYQEALLYIAELINCPVVAVNPSTNRIESHYFLGLGELNIYRQHDLMSQAGESSPFDTSLSVYANERYLQSYLPGQEALIKEAFQLPKEDSVDFWNVHKRVLFVLANTYPYFNPPSPVIAEKERLIGGFYIRPPKELPRDIKDFLQDANYGAIFISLPSQVYGIHLDIEVVNRLMVAFSGMRQKILFEWDGAKIPNPPKNVFIRRWIPMSDILAHPYVQLVFCTGDVWCIQNAIQRMVPVVGIPITREQDLLVQSAVRAGYAQRLLLPEITSELVTNVTKEMFGNQIIIQRIHDESSFYRNRPLGAMEEAVYWVEFAGKYKMDERIYRQSLFQGSIVSPSYYTKMITILGTIAVILSIVLIIGGIWSYKTFVKGSGKKEKKGV